MGVIRRVPGMTMQWFPETDSYICNASFEDREIPGAAGFHWNPHGKYWSTDDPTAAYKLIRFAVDQRTKERLVVTLIPS